MTTSTNDMLTGAEEPTPSPPEFGLEPGLEPENDPESPDSVEPTAAQGRKIGSNRWLIEWAVIICIALAAALLIRVFVFETFFIPSGSMEPTLQVGDRIVVNKLSYDFHGVDRGDIVVFRRPPSEHCGGTPVNDLVKRVIGLPTETIQGKDGHVYINGTQLAEPWLKGNPYWLTDDFGPLKIPKGDYFMMGDHRTDSCDSRIWGPLPKTYFVGKVDLLIWPLSHFKFF